MRLAGCAPPSNQPRASCPLRRMNSPNLSACFEHVEGIEPMTCGARVSGSRVSVSRVSGYRSLAVGLGVFSWLSRSIGFSWLGWRGFHQGVRGTTILLDSARVGSDLGARERREANQREPTGEPTETDGGCLRAARRQVPHRDLDVAHRGDLDSLRGHPALLRLVPDLPHPRDLLGQRGRVAHLCGWGGVGREVWVGRCG